MTMIDRLSHEIYSINQNLERFQKQPIKTLAHYMNYCFYHIFGNYDLHCLTY